ncbi:MAG: hypothetical protein K8R37_04425 [Bacteroidales bacterium]|nr:hypothetical protein [Bacteroidales bacterium]
MKSTMLLEEHTFQFLKELERFDYTLSSIDHVWNILFKNHKEKWSYFIITKYQKTFYIGHINGDYGTLEVEPEKSLKVMDSGGFSNSRSFYENEYLIEKWDHIIASARKWLKVVEKNWIKANKLVYEEYPLNFRYGTVSNSLIQESLPGIYRLDKELGKVRTRKLIRLVEDGFFSRKENTEAESMTAAKYFEYCKIAYISVFEKNNKFNKSLSGEEMYRIFADGRHEGILDIDPDSEQEFADWIDGKHPKRFGGGHPWEIMRGGNTTHIDLYVRRPSYYQKDGFVVELRGESIGRMVETMKMLLAIYDASLPITIANPENVRKRLLCQDNIGIVPEYSSLHRANQHFESGEDVFDVMYYDDIGRYKRRITPFIRWEALPILRLRDI